MAADANEAITEAEAGAVRYCYVTPKVIVTEDRAEIADENAQLVFKVCQNIGFDPASSRSTRWKRGSDRFRATAGMTFAGR
jgi:hypothetical protein